MAKQADKKKHAISIGDIYQAEVIGIQKYGVFVKFAGERKGLIHISELKSGYISDLHELVKIGQKLSVQVIDLDEYTGKISLSARTLEKEPQNHKLERKHFATSNREKIGFKSISEEMAAWVNEAERYLKSKK